MKRRPKNAKPPNRRASNDPLLKAAAPKSATPLTPRRKWLLRSIALALVPLLLVLLEVALRLFGYGHGTGFFETVRVGGRNFLVNNEHFSLRFFPPELMRWPGPIMLEAEKPAGTYRIFILGESAAMGDPEPAYGASRYLEVLLRERFPAARFEVVNVAFTAINSHVILPIARDCARQQGDLWIVYMGNNEMVGPFGAATVFGAKAPPLGLVRLNLALQKTRVGQWVVALSRKLRGKPENVSWGGMRMFLENRVRPDDPSREVVYRNFHRNLRDIVQTGLNSGAKVILNTVAVNLQDCPPLASLINSNLSATVRADCERLFSAGVQAQEQGDFAGAAQRFSEAAQLDSQRADAQFRWGQCLLRLTNYAAAREHFQLACDQDALAFRATSRINQTIHEVGRQFSGPGLELLDAVAALETNSPSGICGQESFYEHVHFNFDGNYRLARVWAGRVESFLPEASRQPPAGDWASQETCERRLALSDWNRSFVVDSILWRFHRAPLSNQFNNVVRLESFGRESRELHQRMNAGNAVKVREFYETALARAPGDHYLREKFAEFLESVGDLKQATVEWQKVVGMRPYHCVAGYQAGRLLEKQDQWAEAEAILSQAVKRRPGLTEAWFELGCVQLGAGKLESALKAFERAQRLEPQNANYCAFVGKALSKLGRRAEAIRNYRQAIQLEDGLWEAHFALGDELVADEKIAEAQREYEAVIRLQPTNALAHLDLGVMLARQGQADAALRQFEETLRLEPANAQARDYLERVRSWKNRQR